MESTWQQVLESLRERTNEHNFNLWFRPIRLLGVEENQWKLSVPNRFLLDWITDNYLDIIERTLTDISRHSAQVHLQVIADQAKRPAKSEEERTEPKPETKKRRKSNKTTTMGAVINPRFTFTSFVSGPSNEFAYAAAKAVAKQPGQSYNPLFIYGGTGLGKTHLLQGISNEINRKFKDLRVFYITAERFMNDLIQSIATNQMAEFKRRYRDNCDVLLMDDIQFISNKWGTQEEFFHTFNFLFESGKQIVVSSDQYPQEIKKLDERIRSRLQSGLVADIKTPDLETRSAILRKKADLDKVEISDEVLTFLAKNIKTNVRELEGSLIQLQAHASLTGAPISIGTAKEVLKSYLQTLPVTVNCEKIQKRVSRYFDIRHEDMLSKSRARKLVVPRQIAMYLVKRYTDLSLTEIGSRFGGKDHATVINAINRVETLMADDMNLRNNVEALEKQLQL